MNQSKLGFFADIEKLTLDNTYFRQVLFTGKHSQLVLMCLKPGEDIGKEVHDVDQFFRIEGGEGKALIGNETFEIEDGSAIVVPAGAEHNITNTGKEDLKLYTIYSPSHHPDGTIHKTKQEAIEHEHE